jgi:hypothetical protein
MGVMVHLFHKLNVTTLHQTLSSMMMAVSKTLMKSQLLRTRFTLNKSTREAHQCITITMMITTHSTSILSVHLVLGDTSQITNSIKIECFRKEIMMQKCLKEHKHSIS